MSTPADDATANPIGTALVYEDEAVRIWRIELEPGEEAAFHTHYLDYTTVEIEGDAIERRDADGTVHRREVEPGRFSRWHMSSRQHSLRNVGARRFRNVIVEVKSLSANFEA